MAPVGIAPWLRHPLIGTRWYSSVDTAPVGMGTMGAGTHVVREKFFVPVSTVPGYDTAIWRGDIRIRLYLYPYVLLLADDEYYPNLHTAQ